MLIFLPDISNKDLGEHMHLNVVHIKVELRFRQSGKNSRFDFLYLAHVWIS